MPSEPAVVLLERREQLLADRPRTDPELAEVTAALEALLDEQPAVRRVLLDDPDEAAPVARNLAALEPVNPVVDEDDLRRRFAEDRRVFVLVHEALQERPGNVVWVALTNGTPTSLQEVLDSGRERIDPAGADTAVYYSIWNVQPGLAGMGGGRELIEAVAAKLGSELANLRTHVTLSPIPGFRRWLSSRGFEDRTPPPGIESLCADYLAGLREDGRPLDPVARFHLGNGARLWRVLPDADRSGRGMKRSWAMMANYRYEPEDRAANRAALGAGRVALGDQVRELLAR